MGLCRIIEYDSKINAFVSGDFHNFDRVHKADATGTAGVRIDQAERGVIMGMQVYQEGPYKIYQAGHGYIVHNARHPFEDKHTHVHTFQMGKKIIHCASHRIVPRSFSFYLLTSLTRISDDEGYIEKIESLIDVRRQKGKKQSYCNRSA